MKEKVSVAEIRVVSMEESEDAKSWLRNESIHKKLDVDSKSG